MVEISVCVDCLILIANGESPPDYNEEDLALWFDRMDRNQIPNHVLVLGDSDEDNEFSWSYCDNCSSPLGGSRHQAFWISTTPTL